MLVSDSATKRKKRSYPILATGATFYRYVYARVPSMINVVVFEKLRLRYIFKLK